MTYIAKPKLHHPGLATNTLGFTHRDYEGAISTLCAGCGHDSISAAIIQRLFRTRHANRTASPNCRGIGCSSKTPDLFPRPEPRLQLRARAHAVGADRRQSRQSRADLSGRLRRRRQRLDRARPVRPLRCAAASTWSISREQRRLRPDQGPVLGDRRQGLEEQEAASSTRSPDRSRRRWRCSWARPSWRAAFPATRSSSCR